MLPPYLIAVAVVGVSAAVVFVRARLTGGRGSGGGRALEPGHFKKFKLTEKIKITGDSFIFRFALDHADQTLGLPIGQHIALRALCNVKKEITSEDGKKQILTRQEVVQHSYTPISSDDDKGHVDFLVKVYFENIHPKFPFGGRLSQFLHGMEIGQTVEMMGPKGRFEYLGNGKFNIAGKSAHVDAFAMIAGGTGITPMLQIIRAIRKNPQDKTKIFLVYGNQTESDILLRKELDEVVAGSPKGQVEVWYTIDRDPSKSWRYDVGFVNEEMLRAHLPAVNEGFTVNKKKKEGVSSVLALMCGPPPMLQFAIKPNLEKMGYSSEMMFSF